MSPRRRVDASDADFFSGQVPTSPRRWGLPLVAGAAVVLIVAAITASALLMVAHRSEHREVVKQAEALSYVRAFMTDYTSLDPFHANDYADRMLSQGTGDFAKAFTQRMNEIVLQVAQAQPTTGSVREAGVQKWNSDGSVDVLVATEVGTVAPDGKSRVENGSRWVATAVEEGTQWKISQLLRVV